MAASPALIVLDHEQAVYRRLAWRLVPFLLLCYMLATIDRFNIGFAKLQFLHDLGLTDEVYGFAAGIFSLGYVAFEVPSNLWLQRIGVRRTLLRIMVLWGAVTCLMMFAETALHFYVLRFLLGVAEAGFFPGILYYLTFWFPDRLRGRMTSLFVMAVPVGGIIAGPLSGWIMEHMQGVAGYHGWQWLFMTEGVPAIVVGIIAFYYLSDAPESTSWLSFEEKNTIAGDLALDQKSRGSVAVTFAQSLRDPRVFLLAFIYFAYFCSLNTILLWAPTVLKAVAGQTLGSIGWISGAISLASTIGMVIIGYSSDHFMERRWHVALCGFTAGACFLGLQPAMTSIGWTVGLLAVASIGIFSVLSLFWTIPSAYLNQSAAAGGIALISSIGSFGGAVSPAMIGWIKVHSGSLYIGLDAIAVLLMVGMIGLLLGIPPAQKPIR